MSSEISQLVSIRSDMKDLGGGGRGSGGSTGGGGGKGGATIWKRALVLLTEGIV